MIELDPELQAALEEAVTPTCDWMGHGIRATFEVRTWCDHAHEHIALVCDDCEAIVSRVRLGCIPCKRLGHTCQVTRRSTLRLGP